MMENFHCGGCDQIQWHSEGAERIRGPNLRERQKFVACVRLLMFCAGLPVPLDPVTPGARASVHSVYVYSYCFDYCKNR